MVIMILFINLKAEYRFIGKELDPKIHSILENGFFVLGDEVRNFEKEFSDYMDNKYAVGVNSGSDALFLAIRSLGIDREMKLSQFLTLIYQV